MHTSNLANNSNNKIRKFNRAWVLEMKREFKFTLSQHCDYTITQKRLQCFKTSKNIALCFEILSGKWFLTMVLVNVPVAYIFYVLK